MVCSPGGHLTQLSRLDTWWRGMERIWVTFDQEHPRSLLAGELVVWAHHPTTRNIPNLIRNLGLAFRVLARLRPEIVVSSGAGVAVPFFLAAKLLRVPTAYLEVVDRVDAPTLSGRLCYPLSDLFLLQWDEQRRFYPKGMVIGRVM